LKLILRKGFLDMSATVHSLIDVGISRHIGKYSDAAEVPRPARWLFTSGTPGILPDGTLPATFELQTEQAWKNIFSVLQKAGMGPEHLVKIVQYLVRTEDMAAYGALRARFLGDCRPASMLMVVAALPKPGLLVEIEAIAAAP
jgi:2-iminobutanoate/2-iminopropanoate deaminase